MVPENRSNPDSRMIRLEYVRFPATGETAGSPIVYLAGGPGGSGINTAKGPRFQLFMAMREFGDVIAFDQRGTGASNDMATCESSQFDPDDEPLSDAAHTELYKRAVDECLAFWAAEGVDVFGYTTTESVKDLDALRQHLGAEKISLWGISYGSHLSLAALKEMDEHIDHVVLASVEGLDQTAKMPARTDAYFERLQAAVNADNELAARYPDIIGLIRRVHGKLERQPLMLSIPQRDGSTAPFFLERRDMQQFTSGLISDPQRALIALELYTELDTGSTAIITQLLSRFLEPNTPVSLRPMNFAMDNASGTGAARKAEIMRQADTALLKDYLNFPMPQLDGYVPGLDLGDEFREAPVSHVPTLVLSGTLDGRTYVESQREAVAGLSNVHILTIENAGHNLFMASPDVTEVIQIFMRGDDLSADKITIDLPEPGMR
ncbi:MAG: alpha/beta hydrolase [Pseudomonadota bacterium]